MSINQANDRDANNFRDEAMQKIGDTSRAPKNVNEGARQGRKEVRTDKRGNLNNDELGRH